MASRPVLFALWLLLQGASTALCADDVAPKALFIANVEALTDEILAGIGTYASDHGMTSIHLPDIQQDFSTALWILSLTGSINLTTGSLSNFETVKRFEGSRALLIEDSNQLVIETGIEIPEINGVYNFDSRAGVVKQHGQIAIKISGLKARTMIVTETSTLTMSMVEMKISDLGNINVKVQDGILGWLVTPIVNLVTWIMQRTIKDTVETKLPEAVNKLLEQLDLAGMLKPPAQMLN